MQTIVFEISPSAKELIDAMRDQGAEIVETPGLDHSGIELIKVVVPVVSAAFLTLRAWIQMARDRRNTATVATLAESAIQTEQAVVLQIDGQRINLITCPEAELASALSKLETMT